MPGPSSGGVRATDDGSWALGCRFISELGDSEVERLLAATPGATRAATQPPYPEDSEDRTVRDVRSHDRAFIGPTLGNLECSRLTTERLHKWLAELAKAPPRLRTREGDQQKFRDAPTDKESARRRQSTANRMAR